MRKRGLDGSRSIPSDGWYALRRVTWLNIFRDAREVAHSAIAMFGEGVLLSSIPSHMIQGRPGCSGTREDAARAAVELCAGRMFADAEWERARIRLLEFTNILRSWDNKTKKTQPKVGNVEVLCQPEP